MYQPRESRVLRNKKYKSKQNKDESQNIYPVESCPSKAPFNSTAIDFASEISTIRNRSSVTPSKNSEKITREAKQSNQRVENTKHSKISNELDYFGFSDDEDSVDNLLNNQPTLPIQDVNISPICNIKPSGVIDLVEERMSFEKIDDENIWPVFKPPENIKPKNKKNKKKTLYSDEYAELLSLDLTTQLPRSQHDTTKRLLYTADDTNYELLNTSLHKQTESPGKTEVVSKPKSKTRKRQKNKPVTVDHEVKEPDIKNQYAMRDRTSQPTYWNDKSVTDEINKYDKIKKRQSRNKCRLKNLKPKYQKEKEHSSEDELNLDKHSANNLKSVTDDCRAENVEVSETSPIKGRKSPSSYLNENPIIDNVSESRKRNVRQNDDTRRSKNKQLQPHREIQQSSENEVAIDEADISESASDSGISIAVDGTNLNFNGSFPVNELIYLDKHGRVDIAPIAGFSSADVIETLYIGGDNTCGLFKMPPKTAQFPITNKMFNLTFHVIQNSVEITVNDENTIFDTNDTAYITKGIKYELKNNTNAYTLLLFEKSTHVPFLPGPLRFSKSHGNTGKLLCAFAEMIG